MAENQMDIDLDTGSDENEVVDEVVFENQPLKRTRAPRSPVWLDFVKKKDRNGADIAICNHCKTQLSATSTNGTSSLKNHLKRCQRFKKKDHGQKELVVNKKDDGNHSVQAFTFSQERSRRDFATMVVKHRYPFAMIDHGYFRRFINNLQPQFDLKHRTTLTTDVHKLFKEEKIKLYHYLDNIPGRISFTTDLWTACTQDSYMCLTGHFVDCDWVLQKKILNFRRLDCSHAGDDIAKVLMECLLDWNIDKKVGSVTLDNAFSNDTMVASLKAVFNRDRLLLSNGDFFQVRCTSHVLNLIVQDGLAPLKSFLANIRESCKYVTLTPQRKRKWNVVVAQAKVLTGKSVHADCKTRWNSTFEMIEVALEYREAFKRLEQREADYDANPSDAEWELAKVICNCLKVFYDCTHTLSGTKYPTADIYFTEICEIHICLLKWKDSEIVHVRTMAETMMVKFLKYWSDCSLILAVAFVLNPGYKMNFVDKYFLTIYQHGAKDRSKRVRDAVARIYDEYALQTTQVSATSQPLFSTACDSSSNGRMMGDDIKSNKAKRFASWYESEGVGSMEAKSELEHYLDEPLSPLSSTTSTLDWWKANALKYPTLSKMARDILAIPATSVPSECAFSTGGRIVDEQRCSLGAESVEAIMCTEDWLPCLGEGSCASSSKDRRV